MPAYSLWRQPSLRPFDGESDNVAKTEFDFNLDIALDVVLIVLGAYVVGINVYRQEYDVGFFVGVGVLLIGLYSLVKSRIMKKKPDTAGFRVNYREDSNDR